MASILLIKGKWRVQFREKDFPPPKCMTFRTKAAAEVWRKQREADYVNGNRTVAEPGKLTVGELIQAYREMRDQGGRPISDTGNEHYMLKALDRGLGEERAGALSPQRLVAYALMRREEGAGPYTINMDLSKLGTVYRYAGAALKVALPDVVGAARPLLAYQRLIGGGGKRERRPTEDELRRVLAYIEEHYGRRYAEAAAFAAISAMRRGEVCALQWADIDEATRVARVWRKHPRLGKTLEKVPLLGEAWGIVQRQPRDSDRVFPMDPGTLSKYFTWTCRALSIVDLHLHDLRHEGTSRLFEEGYAIHQVALVTGHKDWRNLKRYTNLKPEDLTKASRS